MAARSRGARLAQQRAQSLPGALSFALGFALSIAPLPATAQGDSASAWTRCSSANVIVQAVSPRDAARACAGAGLALGFLSAQGLDTTNEIRVSVSAQLPEDCHPHAAGCYVHPRRQVHLRTYAEMQKERTFAEAPVTVSLYQALIAHEVGHAVAAVNFKVVKPSVVAQEYIAYVTMFAAMSAVERDRTLQHLGGSGFERREQINSTVYYVHPAWFGAQAYRHFLKPGNGQVFLQEILAGQVLFED